MLRELGKFEQALFISDQHSPFNVVAVLHLENAPTASVLNMALKEMQSLHPLLRARIIDGKRRANFALMPDSEINFSALPRTDSSQWIGLVDQEMRVRVDVGKGPAWRAIYLFSDGMGDLILTFHHSIIDAAALINLLDKLLRNCSSEQFEHVDDQPGTILIPPVERVFPKKYKGLRRLLPTLSYGIRQFSDEISYQWRSRGKKGPQVRSGGQGHSLFLVIEETLLDRIGKRARRESVTLNSYLNAAMMLAVNRHLYAGVSTPMRTFTFADLRPYTRPPTPPEMLANYISMLRFTQDVSGKEDVWRLAKSLHEKIYHALKYGDKFVASLMSESLMKFFIRVKTLRMGSTALNYSGAIPLQTEYNEIKVTGLHAFISAYGIGPEFASQARIFDNRLWWDFVYLESDMDSSLAEKIVAEIRTILVQSV